LQWVWKTFQGAFYQCSDVRVFTKEANCKGMCQNGRHVSKRKQVYRRSLCLFKRVLRGLLRIK